MHNATGSHSTSQHRPIALGGGGGKKVRRTTVWRTRGLHVGEWWTNLWYGDIFGQLPGGWKIILLLQSKIKILYMYATENYWYIARSNFTSKFIHNQMQTCAKFSFLTVKSRMIFFHPPGNWPKNFTMISENTNRWIFCTHRHCRMCYAVKQPAPLTKSVTKSCCLMCCAEWRTSCSVNTCRSTLPPHTTHLPCRTQSNSRASR